MSRIHHICTPHTYECVYAQEKCQKDGQEFMKNLLHLPINTSYL